MSAENSNGLTNGHWDWQLGNGLRTLVSMAPVCALCRANGDLLNSHIIPEFFYRLVYDPKPRRFHVISAIASEPEYYEQKGLRERLLCKDCEQKLGRWENYAKQAFVDGRALQITQQKDGVVLSNLDYKPFKLFLLSLLWRMSVSKLDFFKEVRLGPYEEKIRLALINEDPLQPEQCACSMVVVQLSGKTYSDWIVEPTLARVGGRHVYSLVITGILFNFHVGEQPLHQSIKTQVLNERGEMAVPVMEMRDIPFLIRFARRFAQARDARRKSRSKA